MPTVLALKTAPEALQFAHVIQSWLRICNSPRRSKVPKVGVDFFLAWFWREKWLVDFVLVLQARGCGHKPNPFGSLDGSYSPAANKQVYVYVTPRELAGVVLHMNFCLRDNGKIK